MKRDQAIKILAVILTISILSVITIAVIQSGFAPKIVGTSVSVLPANVIWSKSYGALGDDDRAYYSVPTSDGYLIVGSSQSANTDITVGLALMLNNNGDPIWNKTYLEGSGTELRFALNLTDGFLLMGNEFLPSGNTNGFVAKISDLGNLLWNKTIAVDETTKLYSTFSTSDGFVLLGSCSSNMGVESQALVVKIDAHGNLVWNKTYSLAADTVARTGVLAFDGNYTVGGYADPRGPNNYRFMLMKITRMEILFGIKRTVKREAKKQRP